MNIRICIAACASLAFFTAAHGDELVNESAVETTTAVLHLPDGPDQTISVRSCAACDAKELRVTQDTHYYVGRDEVPLSALRKSAEINANIYVFYDARARVITRIKLDAVLDPARPPAARGNKRRGN